MKKLLAIGICLVIVFSVTSICFAKTTYIYSYYSKRQYVTLGTEKSRSAGWSKIVDAETGKDVKHQSRARMKNVVTGTYRCDGASVGIGKVFDYSPWVEDISNFIYKAVFHYKVV